MTTRIDSFEGKYRFLSNFWPDNGTTLEHHYQAAKTLDVKWAAMILMAPTPNEAKKLGRRAPIQTDWDFKRIAVMRALVRHKFSDIELAEALLETGDAYLVEGNNWGDTFWGKVNGKGKNWLGKILMETREIHRLAEESTKV